MIENQCVGMGFSQKRRRSSCVDCVPKALANAFFTNFLRQFYAKTGKID